MQRKLAAILSADVKGYSRLMGEDEVATVRTLTAYREVMASLIQRHRGRVVDSPGDNLLAEFASVVDAVQCAVDIQCGLKARNEELPEHRKMEFRIGINLGDVIVEGERIYGDGVNIAARVEGLAEGGGICLSGSAHEQIKNKLALGYESLGEHTVKNIKEPVRVYRVLMEPGATQAFRQTAGKRAGRREWRWAALGALACTLLAAGGVAIWNFYLRPSPPLPAVSSEQAPALGLPAKPSIAVLPFLNMSEDPKQEYFSDGMTEDLITDLSRVSGLFVISRNSVFTYKGRAAKVEEVGRELGVRYVLEGSVRKADDRVRITAQLVDATTGGHLWAERYDRDLKDIFALQDEVTQKIVAALEVKLTEGEQRGLARAPTDNVQAYDYVLRGLTHFLRTTKESTAQGRQMFERAIELDPEYAGAYALLGFTHWVDWIFQWTQGPQSLMRAFELAQRAIALDDSLPIAHLVLGQVYLWQKQHEQAIAEVEKSISLDPNFAEGYAWLGFIFNFSARPEEAIGLVKKAMRLDPHDPFFHLYCLGFAYSLNGRYDEAIAALKKSLSRNPDFLASHTELAVIYSEMGRSQEAQAEAEEVLRLNPKFSLEPWAKALPVKDPAVLERRMAALRKAGLK